MVDHKKKPAFLRRLFDVGMALFFLFCFAQGIVTGEVGWRSLHYSLENSPGMFLIVQAANLFSALLFGYLALQRSTK